MIQRIQTVYFFLAALLSATGFILPVYRIITPPEFITELTLGDTGALGFPILIAYVVAVVLPLVALMLYKNRPLQVRVGRVAILATLAALALLVIKYGNTSKEAGVQVIASIGMFIPIGSIVLLILAIRGVKKDEALVRSADRIR